MKEKKEMEVEGGKEREMKGVISEAKLKQISKLLPSNDLSLEEDDDVSGEIERERERERNG